MTESVDEISIGFFSHISGITEFLLREGNKFATLGFERSGSAHESTQHALHLLGIFTDLVIGGGDAGERPLQYLAGVEQFVKTFFSHLNVKWNGNMCCLHHAGLQGGV